MGFFYWHASEGGEGNRGISAMGVRVVKERGRGIGDGVRVVQRGVERRSGEREREREGSCANLHGVVFGF